MFIMLLRSYVTVSLFSFVTDAEKALIKYAEIARDHQFPYCALLIITCHKKLWRCGASILNQRLLLTAAHCGCNDIHIRVGSGHANISKMIWTEFSGYKGHEHYRPFTLVNDIALVSTKSNLIFDATTQRVAIRRMKKLEKAFYTGWGLTEHNVISDVLKFCNVQLLDDYDCADMIHKKPKWSICGKPEDKYRPKPGTLGGDSGSPLIIRNFIQIGIVSYIENPDLTITVFTYVPAYQKWILKSMKSLKCQ